MLCSSDDKLCWIFLPHSFSQFINHYNSDSKLPSTSFYFYLATMLRYNFLVLALAAFVALVSALPIPVPIASHIRRRHTDVILPRFIYADGRESKSEITTMIALPNGKVILKSDPEWKATELDTLYVCSSLPRPCSLLTPFS
jgi:hypothetical protein